MKNNKIYMFKTKIGEIVIGQYVSHDIALQDTNTTLLFGDKTIFFKNLMIIANSFIPFIGQKRDAIVSISSDIIVAFSDSPDDNILTQYKDFIGVKTIISANTVSIDKLKI